MLPGPRLYGPYFERKELSKAYTNRVNRLLKLLEKRELLAKDDWQPITPTSLWSQSYIEESRDRLKGGGKRLDLGKFGELEDIELDDSSDDNSDD